MQSLRVTDGEGPGVKRLHAGGGAGKTEIGEYGAVA